MMIHRILQKHDEFAHLVRLFRAARPRRVIEIGVHRGGTLWHWLEHVERPAKLAAMDIAFDAWGSYLFSTWAAPDVELRCFAGDCRAPETVDAVRDFFAGERVDFLFIDGDHRYDAVRGDWEIYRQLVRPAGLVAFHDIVQHPAAAQSGVSQLWSEIQGAGYQTHEIIEDLHPRHDWSRWGGIGVVVM